MRLALLPLLVTLACSAKKNSEDKGVVAAEDASPSAAVLPAEAGTPPSDAAPAFDAGIVGHGTGSGSVSGGGESAPVPRVRIRKTKVIGQLDQAIVHRVLRNEASAFRACYKRALQNAPDIEGKMDLQFTIIQSGRTRAVRARGLRKEVDACVAKRVERIVFPSGSWDGTVQVSYALSFTAQ